MRCLVSGVAGFIGSHLAERLVRDGQEVIGIDCFLDYYPREVKEENLAGLKKSPNFHFQEANLLELDLPALVQKTDFIFHLAAQAGVRASWGESFSIYTENNIRATQRLLESCKGQKVSKFILASSSSVYGDAEEMPTSENSAPKPVSPYGLSKLACEHLCYLYWKNHKIPYLALRYFTVYGPRQRPDMAFHKFLRSALHGKEIEIYGDGNQTRDFTYISDIINATVKSISTDAVAESVNLGGGSPATIWQVLNIIEEITGKRVRLRHIEEQKGDVRHTCADITKAQRILGYAPQVRLGEGLRKQFLWQKGGMLDAY
ncbi:MAG: UDP-glucose 4-epimerase [Nitrospinae bacterium RIFCSPLOWO2_12_FULL_45_22]|nr:MAG: UDP-glucose 4-epimerase [Nitrospinae bacterium RIFCSPLOWO2_12_FULL_45_22]